MPLFRQVRSDLESQFQGRMKCSSSADIQELVWR